MRFHFDTTIVFMLIGDAAERKAQSAIIGKAPTTLPGVPNAPAPSASKKSKRTTAGTHTKRKRRRLEGSGMTVLKSRYIGGGTAKALRLCEC